MSVFLSRIVKVFNVCILYQYALKMATSLRHRLFLMKRPDRVGDLWARSNVVDNVKIVDKKYDIVNK